MPSISTKVKIKTDFKGLDKLSRNLNRNKDRVAQVGHFDGKQHFIGTEETIAGISLINQQGNSKIPARPYMLAALESSVFMKAYKKAVERIAKDESTIYKELPKLGKLLEELMMGVIQTNPWPKQNSPETVKKKGFNHPLIETATLVNDIESRIVKDVGKKREGLNRIPV